ncbi:TIGR02206 family membrane protein [Bacillus taeanensis]|uniref:TIGR02206 family membrane protein n=1 Tax=Bacillus taeanensis TaxID=273032 RepID=A0A366Y2S9_9BACI|nr:TIGR02206 family membrane protein [Bacillus taeanensis]RBW70713.1 TIGR02206 family membrane protein [Bacillus taeanensis]
MNEFFIPAYEGRPFQLFSTAHVFTLVTVIILFLLMFLFRQHLKNQLPNRLFRYSLALLLILSEISLHSWLLYAETWQITSALPLHLSSISLILSTIMLVSKSYFLFELMYFAGLGSALQAMLTPDLGMYSFPHFRYVHFYISHGGIAAACVFMVVVEEMKPTLKSLWKTFFLLNAYIIIVFGINLLLDGNYLYIMEKPSTGSILDYLGPWPWYIVPLEVVTLLTFLILYSPFALYSYFQTKST